MSTAEQEYVKDEIRPMVCAAYEAGLIDSYALHFMIGSLNERVGLWDQEDFYRYFQKSKASEPRK